jgi:hypothetical protein
VLACDVGDPEPIPVPGIKKEVVYMEEEGRGREEDPSE